MLVPPVADDSILKCIFLGITWSQLSDDLVSTSGRLVLPSHVFRISVYFFFFRVHS